MGLGLAEVEYGAATRRRNRITVSVLTAAAVIAVLVAGAATSWPMANAIPSAGLVLVFGACLWWMFASRRAGKVRFTKSPQKIINESFGTGSPFDS